MAVATPRIPRSATPANPSAKDHTSRRVSMRLALGLLYLHETLTGPELAEWLEVPRSTAIGILNSLAAKGYVMSEPRLERSGPGRPPLNWRLDPARGLYIGVGLEPRRINGVVVDAAGHTVLKCDLGEPQSAPAEGAIFAETLARRIREELMAPLLRDAQGAPMPSTPNILGVGIGVSGIVDSAQRGIIHSHFLDQRHVPLATLVETHLGGVSVRLHHDAHVAALAEWLAPAAPPASPGVIRRLRPSLKVMRSLLFYVMNLDYGIGAGLILAGNLWSGARNAAGEISGLSSLRDQYLQRLAPQSGKELSELTWAQVIRAAGRGDAAAAGLHHELLEGFAQKIMDAACLIDPTAIVIGGEVPEKAPEVVDELKRALEHKYGGLRISAPEVRSSLHQGFAVAHGAAMGFTSSYLAQAYAFDRLHADP